MTDFLKKQVQEVILRWWKYHPHWKTGDLWRRPLWCTSYHSNLDRVKRNMASNQAKERLRSTSLKPSSLTIPLRVAALMGNHGPRKVISLA